VPDTGWGDGWKVANDPEVVAILFNQKPSCGEDTPERVVCQLPDCYSLRIDFVKR
jgi:hypothetical protein